MGIFNRKLLVLLIFINCFNNIYIFCGNGVEVEEIRDLDKAKDSDRPIGSFINDDKRTEKSDGESTQESNDENHIDGDKNEIIVQNPTENSPIIKEEQGKITNWIKKNKILFSFLSIMTFIGGFFGIKSLVQGLSGKKNEMEGDETEGGDDENLGSMFGNHHQGDKQLPINQIKHNFNNNTKKKDEKQGKELLKEKTIVFCDLNKEKLIDRIICYTEIIGETNYNKLQKIKDELLQELQKNDQQKDDPKDLNLQVELPTIEYFNEVIKKNQNLTSIKNSLEIIRNELANLLKDYDIEDLKVELPTIEYFNKVIKKNQNLINLINTPFNNNGEWQDCENEQVPKESEGFLWHENGVIINQDQKHINNRIYSFNKSYKMYINKQDNTIIAVNDDRKIIKQVVNFEQKFFIGLDDEKEYYITIHFDNFKIRVCALNNSIDTWFPLVQFMKKQKYSLNTFYTLLGNANNQLALVFMENGIHKNNIFINIDEKFIILTQEIAKKFKKIYEEISQRTQTT